MAEDEKIPETSTISMSVKICGRTTSFTMKKNIVALWILMSDIPKKKYKDHLSDFVYKKLNSWKGDSAKGFSDYITEQLIIDVIDLDDVKKYQKILKEL